MVNPSLGSSKSDFLDRGDIPYIVGRKVEILELPKMLNQTIVIAQHVLVTIFFTKSKTAILRSHTPTFTLG